MKVKWSDEGFRARVELYASQQGKSVWTVLKEAGLAGDALKPHPGGGRNINTIVKIANALGVLPHELMVFTILPDEDDA